MPRPPANQDVAMIRMALASIERALPQKPPAGEQDVERRRGELTERLLSFVPRISPRYRRPLHLRRLVEHLARAILGEPMRVLVSVPPRHGKTETILHTIAASLTIDPSIVWGYATYAAGLARSKSRNARDYARAAGVAIREDADALHEWRTPEGGGVLAAGVGGPWTGHGVRILVVDDPHKDRAEAESKLVRDTVHGWCTSTGFTRLEPGGSIFVIHTRWHVDDEIGKLEAESEKFRATDGAEGEGWTYLNLQAIDDETGEALWPEQWPVTYLLSIQRRDEYVWLALYQGRPRKKGGEVFREPARNTTGERRDWRVAIGVDVAGTKSTRANRTAAVVLGYWWEQPQENEPYELHGEVLEVVSVQEEIPEVAEMLEALQAKWGMAPLVIETQGIGKAVPQTLRILKTIRQQLKGIKPSLRIVSVNATADKYMRAQPVAAAWNWGRIRLPMSAPWLEDFLYVVSRFSGLDDDRDDEVDALAHVYNWAFGAGVVLTAGVRVAGAREMATKQDSREARRNEDTMRRRLGIGGGGGY